LSYAYTLDVANDAVPDPHFDWNQSSPFLDAIQIGQDFLLRPEAGVEKAARRRPACPHQILQFDVRFVEWSLEDDGELATMLNQLTEIAFEQLYKTNSETDQGGMSSGVAATCRPGNAHDHFAEGENDVHGLNTGSHEGALIFQGGGIREGP